MWTTLEEFYLHSSLSLGRRCPAVPQFTYLSVAHRDSIGHFIAGVAHEYADVSVLPY